MAARLPIFSAMSRPAPAAGLVLAVALLTLAGAWAFQAMGYIPCELCLKERYPYYAALPLAAAALFLARNGREKIAKLILALLAAIFFAGAVFGAYHAGVEWKFWPGPSTCTGDFVKPASMADFRQQLQHIHIVRCDKPALRIFGLSLADWNVVIAAGLSLLALRAARSKRAQ
jgi:disulfide bond formation protein DsbB